MREEYKVVGKFQSSSHVTGKMIEMIVVQDSRGACTMPIDEWKLINAVQDQEQQIKRSSVA